MPHKRKFKLRHKKIIIRSKGQFEINTTDGIYEMDLQTGEVKKATLIPQEMQNDKEVYKIDEKTLHIYIPAASKDMAVIKFNSIINSSKRKK